MPESWAHSVNKQNKDIPCKLLWRINNIMVSFQTVRDYFTHLYKGNSVALYVGYLWLYFSLSPQLVCVSGRMQVIAFLSIKNVFNFFFLLRNEGKYLFYQFGVMRANNVTGRKLLKNCDFFVHLRGKAITESEHRGSDLGALEGLSPFDSTLQCPSRNVETLLNRQAGFICKNTWRKWGRQYCSVKQYFLQAFLY